MAYDSRHKGPYVDEGIDRAFALSNDNLLINGDFRIWQRGTEFNMPSTTQYSYVEDRWGCFMSGGGKVTKSVGLKNGIRLEWTVTGTKRIVQKNEDYQLLIGKTCTLSFEYSGDGSTTVVGFYMDAGVEKYFHIGSVKQGYNTFTFAWNVPERNSNGTAHWGSIKRGELL